MANGVINRTPLPSFTADERRQNLEKAARLRLSRAHVKEQFAKGELSFLDIVQIAHNEKENNQDLVCAKLRVNELIRSCPGIGKAKCQRIMQTLKISPMRCIGGLGRRQIEELNEVLYG